MFAVGCRKTLTTAVPFRDWDSMCSILSTVVVSARSVILTMRSLISSGTKPLKLQMTLTTGMSILGKMSVGVRTIVSAPRIKIRIANTAIVYGRLSASLTIHIRYISIFPSDAGRTAFTKSTLRPVRWSLGIQCRDQLLGCWWHGDRSRQHNFPGRNFPAVQTAVVAIVRTNCGTFEGDSGKQATRP